MGIGKLFEAKQSPILRQIAANRLSTLAVGLIGAIFVIAIFAPFLNPYDPTETDFMKRFIAPNEIHPFGTDSFGRDVLSVIVWGARTDLLVAIIVAGGATALGTILGLIAGYWGGKIDRLISYVVDVFLALPSLILAMAFAVAIGRSFFNLTLALILAGWPVFARLVRGQVLREKEVTYVQAGKVLGFSNIHIALRHVLPNCSYPIIIQSTLDVGQTILRVASLSFIGFGFPVLTPEWGAILLQGRDCLFTAPWVVFFPSIFVIMTVIGFNLVGDAIRDILDPRLRSVSLT